MRTIIDLTDEDVSFGGMAGDLPAVTLVDDMDIVIGLGETEIRLTYGQFDELLNKMTAWVTEVPDQPSVSEQPPEPET